MTRSERLAAEILKMPKSNGRELRSIPRAGAMIDEFVREALENVTLDIKDPVFKDWEYYCDESYYGLWAVRKRSDTSFNSPYLFHFVQKEDAVKFMELIGNCFVPVTR